MRRAAAILPTALVLVSSACYSYVPVTGTPVPGQEIALVVTDRGRVALNERLEPEIDELRGTLVRKTDSSYTLAMKQTVTLRRTTSTWAGESLSVASAFVGTVRRRELSRSRSWLVAGGAAAAVVAFIATRSFLDGNTSVETDTSKPPTGPGPASVRIPVSFPFRSH
ncbi:hypothetical protein [Gemmatimonas sp.]|uniref:hypothetical protein n=1 Tax=Gemmatimonas sp. TaxID=1962908 RepID=UPI0025BE650A|nr:hypothetical protein [Gemmatimonas sp.]MCA2984323.1 hypothetical protein [Gemmatimonas sp.]